METSGIGRDNGVHTEAESISTITSAALKKQKTIKKVADLVSEVKELHRLSSQDLSKLLKDSDNFSFMFITESGSSLQIDIDKLVRFLPLHLLSVLLSSQRDEALLRYLLSGFRLLQSFCEMASRHPKLEQILLDDVRVSAQLLDLVFYLLIVFTRSRQEHDITGCVSLVHSALVACSMYLLTVCISSQWHELAYVLLAHPKVDIFMDAAFGAVRKIIKFLQIKLLAQESGLKEESCLDNEKSVSYLCLQCEATLQFLQLLCQHKSFRERLLKHQELSRNGGMLQLALATLKLNISPSLKDSPAVFTSVSRLKSGILSILLHLCEAETVSYLDEIASVPASMDLAKSVAAEVIALLKTTLGRDPKKPGHSSGKTYHIGLLQLNALRLADFFSDDSNFRSHVMMSLTEVLGAIFSLPYQEFLSSWCSSDLPLKEANVRLEYEPFIAAGWILDRQSSESLEFILIPTNMPQASYAHQRTSLLVKVLANLHCFVPKICEEQERNLFLTKFLECLQLGSTTSLSGLSVTSESQKAAVIRKNLRSLLGHAESLIPTFLNDEDVQLLRVFFSQFQGLIGPAEDKEDRTQDKGHTSPLCGHADAYHKCRIANLKEGMSENSSFPGVDNSYMHTGLTDESYILTRQDMQVYEGRSRNRSPEGLGDTLKDIQNAETSGSDSSCIRRKNSIDHMDNGEKLKISEYESSIRAEKVESTDCEEKRPRKRKRSIMNEKQVSIIETALLEEPEMQKNAASIQSWAKKISSHGSEVTPAQLKNWLNNRKARLARASKDNSRPLPEGDGARTEKLGESRPGPSTDSPECSAKDKINNSLIFIDSLRTNNGENCAISLAENSSQTNVQGECSTSSSVRWQAGHEVVLTDTQGNEIAKATVYQVEGEWHGWNLEETKTCVVDIHEVKSDRLVKLPPPPVPPGSLYEESEIKVGDMRVLWDTSRMVSVEH